MVINALKTPWLPKKYEVKKVNALTAEQSKVFEPTVSKEVKSSLESLDNFREIIQKQQSNYLHKFAQLPFKHRCILVHILHIYVFTYMHTCISVYIYDFIEQLSLSVGVYMYISCIYTRIYIYMYIFYSHLLSVGPE